MKQVKLTLILVISLDYLVSLRMSLTFDHLAWMSNWIYIICKIGREKIVKYAAAQIKRQFRKLFLPPCWHATLVSSSNGMLRVSGVGNNQNVGGGADLE